jgi:acetyl esterase/lipase
MMPKTVLGICRLAFAFAELRAYHEVWGDHVAPFADAFSGLAPESCTDTGPFGDQEDGQCENVRVPTLNCTWTGSAIVAVVIPGGGFQGLSIGREGQQVQDWLVDLAGAGVSACVLKYRVPAPAALDYAQAEIADAQRAIKVLRNLTKAKIGVIGFSAGGFLAGSMAIFNQTYASVDSLDDACSAVPDFVMMVYPGLNGKVSNRTLVEHISAGGLRISTDVPFFLEQSKDDPFDSDAQNNDAFKRALLEQGAKPKQHIYDTGSHAYGLCNIKRGDDVAALVASNVTGPPVVPGWVHAPDACRWKVEAERFLAELARSEKVFSV